MGRILVVDDHDSLRKGLVRALGNAGHDIEEAANGTVAGSLYNDANNNNQQDAGESNLGGFEVYLDQNGNGTLDSGEPTVPAEADGSFILVGLGFAANQVLRLIGQDGWTAAPG